MKRPLMYGTLNLEELLSFLSCITNTPPQTKTKANKVPILTRSITISRLRNKAGTATTNPVTTVENEGVLYFGWIRENALGKSPSLLMLIQILGCPSW